eukprot:gene12951-7529_t
MEEDCLFQVECEVLYKRVFGKKLSFLTGINTKDATEIELKLGQTEFIKKTKLGDIIQVTGTIEKGLLIVMDLKYLEKSQENVNYQRTLLKSEKNENQKSLCKIMKETGKCEKKNCQQRHFYLENELKRFEKMKNQQIFMKQQVLDKNDPFEEKEKNSKKLRAKEYAKFLVETFGLDNLKSGPVLDIAGGRGFVSYYLSLLYGIECYVVDPRGSDLPKKYQKSLKKKNIEFKIVKLLFDENFDENLIQKSSLIFGMHPDEATESIVQVSLLNSKNFAVVPCCVFPNLFPRKLKNGTEVIEYFHFIDYLNELIGDDVQHSFLPIKGRNKIIYKKIDQNFEFKETEKIE